MILTFAKLKICLTSILHIGFLCDFHLLHICDFPIECSFPTPYPYTNMHDIEISLDGWMHDTFPPFLACTYHRYIFGKPVQSFIPLLIGPLTVFLFIFYTTTLEHSWALAPHHPLIDLRKNTLFAPLSEIHNIVFFFLFGFSVQLKVTKRWSFFLFLPDGPVTR